MARGWESKSVEAQQAESLSADKAPGATGAGRDPARDAMRASLRLARTRALADLQLACAPAHRGMLEHAIRDLDAQLALLDV